MTLLLVNLLLREALTAVFQLQRVVLGQQNAA